MEKQKIRNMSFPDHDGNWIEVLDMLKENNWHDCTTISPVEFCNKLRNSVPYEWSYWQELSAFECLILHKGMYDRLRNDFLDGVESAFEYVFGNAVFNVYVSKENNISNIKGHKVHFSLNDMIQGIKKLLKIGKQYKARPKEKNILLVTANHSGNIGDDAITLASLDILQEAYPDATVIIDKGPASKELISRVELVVLGGGGIFYDHCFYNVQNYCQYLLYAHEFGIDSAAIGIGAQGITTECGSELYRRSLDTVKFISVRDPCSYKKLKHEVVPKTNLYTHQDVVFGLKNSKSNLLIKKESKPVLLFSLLDASIMPTSNSTKLYQKSQTECVEFLTRYFDVILFVQSKDDLNMYKKLKDLYQLNILELEYSKTREVVDVYSQADLVLTSRLHGFIFSCLAQTPVITVASSHEGSKLGSMVFDSVPSAKSGFIVLKEYCLDLLKQKVDLYLRDPDALVPDVNEVNKNKNIVNKLPQLFKDQIKL